MIAKLIQGEFKVKSAIRQPDHSGWLLPSSHREKRQPGGDPAPQYRQGGSWIRHRSTAAVAHVRAARRAAHELGLHASPDLLLLRKTLLPVRLSESQQTEWDVEPDAEGGRS